MDRADLAGQFRVPARTLAGATLLSSGGRRISGGPGDQVPADRGGEGTPQRLPAVPRAGCAPRQLLRLVQAAFFNISRSSSRIFTWRRSLRSSSRSLLVNPSSRRPASRSACLTQLRMHWADGSNCRASSSGVRPDRTRRTISARNSGGYGGRDFGTWTPSSGPIVPSGQVSTRTGQLQSPPLRVPVACPIGRLIRGNGGQQQWETTRAPNQHFRWSGALSVPGGGWRIRTSEAFATVLQTAPFGRSGNPPRRR